MINCHYGPEKGKRMEFINDVAHEIMKGKSNAEAAAALDITEDEVVKAMDELNGFNPEAYATIMQMLANGDKFE